MPSTIAFRNNIFYMSTYDAADFAVASLQLLVLNIRRLLSGDHGVFTMSRDQWVNSKSTADFRILNR